ncbi:PPC domain-containing DNA-binding protein [Roseiflexus sp.]
MSVTMRLVANAGQRVYATVLRHGVDLHRALAGIATAQQITAASVQLLGGLREAAFAETDFATGVKKPSLVFRRPLEIIGGGGMISMLDQAPHVHLHLTLSFQDASMPCGIAVVGGHVAYALAHAVEAFIICYDGCPLVRHTDPDTGLLLWDLPPSDINVLEG